MSISSYVSKEGKKLFKVYVQGFDARGVRIQWRRAGIETHRAAEKVEFELKRELAKIREEEVPYRWTEWYSECLKRMKMEYQPSTLENYETQLPKWIHPKWGNLELREITKAHVHQIIYEDLAGRVSPNTQKSILKMVRRILQLAVEEGALDRNPTMGVQVKVPEVEQKVLTNSEVEIFLREAKLTRHRLYPTWFMALKTGMRSGELMALTWNDIDLDGKMISVSRQWTSKFGFAPTKTKRSRVVPISEDLSVFLKALKLEQGSKSEFVLPRLTEWTSGMQAKVTREFCAVIGVTPVKFHDLRATFITNLLGRGVPLAQVMAVVGHHQLKTTNGYLRKAGVEVRGVAEHLGYKAPVESGAEVFRFPMRQRGQ
jgi:integrase